MVGLLGLPAGAGAQVASDTPGYRLGKPFKEVREEYRARVLELKASSSALRQELKADLKNSTSSGKRALRQEWVKLKMEQLSARLTAALKRSQNLLMRLESFIAQPENEGRDFTAAKAKLQEAKTAITTGEKEVREMKNKVAEALATTTPRLKWPEVKSATTEAIAAVKAAHQKVVEAIRLVKNN